MVTENFKFVNSCILSQVKVFLLVHSIKRISLSRFSSLVPLNSRGVFKFHGVLTSNNVSSNDTRNEIEVRESFLKIHNPLQFVAASVYIYKQSSSRNFRIAHKLISNFFTTLFFLLEAFLFETTPFSFVLIALKNVKYSPSIIDIRINL